MSATTRWRDTQTTDFKKALAKLEEAVVDDERSSSIYWVNFHNTKCFIEDQSIVLNNETIVYNMIRYRYDQMSVSRTREEDRPLIKSGFIIVYSYRGTVNYIVDQNSQAKKLLRKLLNYTGKNEIDSNSFDFSEDFFVWLVSRVYNSDVVIESASASVLTMEEIKGIRGDTEDQQTKVSASGESVMNVISTLSFMLESRKLTQVILSMSYTGHENICVKINKTTVEYLRPYKGAFEKDDNEKLVSQLYLLLYIEILPILEQEYMTNKADEVWTQSAYADFLKELKDSIIDKIENKIAAISK